MANPPFFYDSPHKAAFLANMAGRLKDQICDYSQQQFDRLQLVIPVGDVSLVMFVKQTKSASIAEIAEALNYSHQRVAARINALIELKCLTRTVDKRDQRRKVISLTRSGIQQATKIEKYHQKAAKVFEQLFKSIDCDLMAKLLAAVDSLERLDLMAQLD